MGNGAFLGGMGTETQGVDFVVDFQSNQFKKFACRAFQYLLETRQLTLTHAQLKSAIDLFDVLRRNPGLKTYANEDPVNLYTKQKVFDQYNRKITKPTDSKKREKVMRNWTE